MQNKIIVFLFIFLSSAFTSFIDDFSTIQIQNLIQSQEGKEYLIWQYGLLSIAIQMIFPLMTLLLMIWFLFASSEHPIDFFKKHFEQLVIENLRCWGFILMGGLFLIIPAFIIYFLYLFVPFIVVIEKNYIAGNIDALQFSRQLVMKNIFKVGLISLVVLVVLPLLSSGIFAEWNSFVHHPLTALPLHLIDVGIQFLATYSIGHLFIQIQKKQVGEPNATTYV